MASARPSTLGTALSVQLDPGGTEPPITGTVRWQEKRDGEYAIGCSVNRAEGVEQLCRLCDLSSDSDQGGKPAERYGERVRSTLSLAAVWLLVALGGTVLGLGVINGRHPSTKRWLADRKMISDRKTAEINYRPGHRVALEIETTDSPRLPVVAPLAMQDTTVQRMHGPDTSGLLLVREVSVPDPDVGLEPPPLTTEPDSGATERRLIPLVNEPSVEKVELIIGDHGSVVPSFVRRAAQADPTAPESAASGIARQVRTPTFETRAAATIARVRSDPASRVSGRSNIDLTKAKKALIAGEKYYRADRYDEAIRCFQAATRHDPRSPLHFYLLAMSYYEQRRFGDAGEAAQRAFELERKWPIENRGSRLSRYQGRARMWIERIRSESTASAS